LAVAFFLGAQHDATVPLLTLPAAFAADGRGPTSDPDNPLFQHVGTNYLKGRLRSHPDVAKRRKRLSIRRFDGAVALVRATNSARSKKVRRQPAVQLRGGGSIAAGVTKKTS
jgi:hypothetical protein